MLTYQIHLIRHGLTAANRDGRYIGATDLPLSPEGRQALKHRREQTSYPEVQALFTSPLLRCRQTAALLYPGREATPVEELREYDFGVFEGKTAAELDGRPDYVAWISGRMAPPGGEETRAFTERLCLGLHKIVREMMARSVTSAAAVLHGGALMTLLHACALPRRQMLEWTADDGCGYTIRVTPSLYQRSGIVEVVGALPRADAEEDS